MKKCNALQALSDVITFPPRSTDIIPADTLLNRFFHLVREVPFYELRFVQDRSFWPYIDAKLQKIGIKNARK